jgi:hypothetical protein
MKKISKKLSAIVCGGVGGNPGDYENPYRPHIAPPPPVDNGCKG